MNKTDKIKEGMTLIEVKEHYRPLEEPMVEETSKKVRKIITGLYQKKHIDEMTFNGYLEHRTLHAFHFFTLLQKHTRSTCQVDQ